MQKRLDGDSILQRSSHEGVVESNRMQVHNKSAIVTKEPGSAHYKIQGKYVPNAMMEGRQSSVTTQG